MDRLTYFNSKLHIEFNNYLLSAVDPVPQPLTVSTWLDEIHANYSHRPSVFKALGRVDVWHTDRPDCGDIKRFAGLCYPYVEKEDQGYIEIAHRYCDRNTLSHEFGHWVAMWERIDPSTNYFDPYGLKMWQLYLWLRGSDCTEATPPTERWAEDFRFYFGAKGVRGVLRPEDDHFTKGVRAPNQVPGLLTFMRDFGAVLDYWRQVPGVQSQSYDPYTESWYWWRPLWWVFGRWERYSGGRVQYESWGQWVNA